MPSVSQLDFNYFFRFNPKDIVIEYVGEKIRTPVGDRREGYYDALRNFEVLAMTKNQPKPVEESEPWTPSTVPETTT